MRTRIWLGNLKYEDHVGNLSMGGKTSKRMLRRTGCEVLERIRLVKKEMVDCCEHWSGAQNFINAGNFLASEAAVGF